MRHDDKNSILKFPAQKQIQKLMIKSNIFQLKIISRFDLQIHKQHYNTRFMMFLSMKADTITIVMVG
jgi:hypothetical protein